MRSNVQTEMMQLLENEDLARTPIIVLANKQDLKDAMQVLVLVGCGNKGNG